MKKLELQDYKKMNKNLLAKSYSRFEPVGVGYLLVCKHYVLFCYIVCVREKKTNTKQSTKKKNNNNNNNKTTSFEGGGGTGSDPKFLISSFCFLFSTVSLLHLSFQEDY